MSVVVLWKLRTTIDDEEYLERLILEENNNKLYQIGIWTDCQSLSGSAFRTVAFSEKDAFSFLKGEPRIYVKTGDSGNKREQAFCSDCGSPIYSTSVGDEPKEYGIRLGTVNQRNLTHSESFIHFVNC